MPKWCPSVIEKNEEIVVQSIVKFNKTILLCAGLSFFIFGCTSANYYDASPTMQLIENEIRLTKLANQKREDNLSSWKGADESEFIASWGKPFIVSTAISTTGKRYKYDNPFLDGMKDNEKAFTYWAECTTYLSPQDQITYHSGTIGNTPFEFTSTTPTMETKTIESGWTAEIIFNENGKIDRWWIWHPPGLSTCPEMKKRIEI